MGQLIELRGIKKYITPTNIAIGAGIIIVGYLGSQFLSKQKEQPTTIAGDYTVSPMGIKPNLPGTITLTGSFDSPVDNAFYYIYDSNRTLIASGSLGHNVTNFVKAVNLPPLPLGIFDIDITDTQRGIAPAIEAVDENI